MPENVPGSRGGPARVLIVDDHPVVREGLAAQIALHSDLEVCGEAEDIADALACFKQTRPDVAVIDISLKSGNGIDLIKILRERNESLRIVVWSMYPESLYAERAVRAGAMAYVTKSRATQEIVQAIHSVLAGKLYLSEETSGKLLGRVVGGGSKAADRAPIEDLSDRELEAFKLMGEGLTTEQIAARMHISPKTVETYRVRIKDKLGVSNVTELIQRATRWVLENL